MQFHTCGLTPKPDWILHSHLLEILTKFQISATVYPQASSYKHTHSRNHFCDFPHLFIQQHDTALLGPRWSMRGKGEIEHKSE